MRKRIVFLFVFIIIVAVHTTIDAKYVIEYTNTVANIKVDAKPPKIELISVSQINSLNQEPMNKVHTITAQIRVLEKNIRKNNLNQNHITILVGDKEINSNEYEIEKIEENAKMIIYEIKLNKILADGKLKIKVKEGTIEDISNNKNREEIFEI